MILNEAFERMLSGQLQQELPDFLHAMDEPAQRALRLNGRLSVPPLPDLEGPVPWAKNGFYLSADSKLGQTPAHEAGAFYIQEPSAMAAAAALAPEPRDTVLDLCAAPGGKSTQLAEYLTEGTLIANEIHPARARILSSNIERMGLGNTIVTCADPERLRRVWPRTFDRVLVDAPCSGEGMFRKNPEAVREWQPGSPVGCAARQKPILDCAAEMLKPGGRLVYSTCTFNRTENEDQINAFLSRHPDFETVPFSLPGLPPAPDGMLKVWPHRVRGEGHFVALLQKRQAPFSPPVSHPFGKPDARLIRDGEEALSGILKDPPHPNGALGETLLCLPPFVPDLTGISVLRAGLSLGRFQKKAFLPDHALSRACVPNTIFPVNPDEALSYLHGETLAAADPAARGFGVVTTEGLPLGWGKASDVQIKNHYPKGLRK